MKDSDIGVRHRKGKRETVDYLLDDHGNKDFQKDEYRLPNLFGFAAVVIGLLILLLFSKLQKQLPSQLSVQDEFSNPERFIGKRAESFLKRLTDIGTRVVGSYENEVLTVDLLQREISFIAQQTESIHKIETDIQKPTGSYYLYFKPKNYRNYYANIQNIVVRFSSTGGSKDSLLINCHYDTVPESPGASDNGLNCAVLLEVLTKLSKSKKPFHNTVIFLFNGAEENPLQASHGFITQHKWSKDVKAVINLDSAGAGGREVLFQATSAFPWLLKMYAKAARHPSGSVLAEELFLSGIIPSDTDFRIFRDFGKVAGLDFAHAENGYVYHTKFDTMDYIPPGTYQHTGDNILALVTEIARSPELGELYKLENKNEWRVVYFDIFWLYTVIYTEFVAVIINVAIAGFSTFTIFRTFSIISETRVFKMGMVVSVGIQLMSILMSSAMLILISKVIDTADASMSWYNRPWFIIPLYFFPHLFTSALLPVLYSLYMKNIKPETVAVSLINGSQFLWTIALVLGTAFRIRASFCIALIVFPSALASAVTTYSRRNFSEFRYLLSNVVFSIFPILFVCRVAVQTFTVLIPMTARMGAHSHPELVIAVLVLIFSILTTYYLVPIVVTLRKPKCLLLSLCALHVLGILTVTATPLGFPYSGDLSQPALQRFYIMHSERTFHDSKGNVRKADSGFFVLGFDRNNINYVSKVVPQLQNTRSASVECLSELNCGSPFYTHSFINPAPFGNWVPASAPVIHHPTNLEVVSQTPIDIRTRKIHFIVSGPDHISMMISPRVGVQLIKWSFDELRPKTLGQWINRDTYMIYYSHGLMGGVLEFDLYLEVDQNTTVSESMLDIAVVGHYMHDKLYRTEDYRNFLSRFPDWAHVTAWTSTYKSWVI